MSQSPEKPAERRKANPERRGGIELDRSAKAFGKPPRLHQNKMNIRTAIQLRTTVAQLDEVLPQSARQW
jgi:hypothetical protein